MSGYLAHLVSRTLGLAPPLSPMRRSRFEGNSGDEVMESDLEPPSVELTEIQGRASPARSAHAVRAVGRRVGAPEREAGMAHDAQHSEAHGRLDAVVALSPRPASIPDTMFTPEPGGSNLPIQEPVAGRGGNGPSLRSGTQPSRPLAREPANVGGNPVGAHSVLSERREAPGTGPPRSVPRGRRERGDFDAGPSLRRDEASNAVPDSSSGHPKAQPPAAAGVMMLLPAPRTLPPALTRGPSTETRHPDVHITIGSVEIRAHQAAARPGAAARPPRALRPALSLDAYLDKRRERRS